MTKLLLDAGANINTRSATLHDTALARAAQNGNGPTVRVLLAAGARVDDKDGSDWTPLFNAALKGDLEIIEALLSAGADVNARSSNGWTALKEAQMRGYQNVAQRLKSAGAIDFPDGSR
jgi:ankyrin repeat protein